MADKGYFLWHRQAECNFLHPLQENRKFTKFEAWLDLVSLAYFKKKEKLVQGKKVLVERGSFVTATIQLAQRWKWHRTTTENFLTLLESEDMITRYKLNENNTRSCTMLKINKYNDFQPVLNEECTTDDATECTTGCTPKNESNKSNKLSKDNLLRTKSFKNSLPLFREWDCVQNEDFRKWLAERELGLSPSALKKFNTEFVKTEKERCLNWLDQKGKRQKDYVAFFKNWILKALEGLK